MAPVVLVGLVMNFLFICVWYHSQLRLGSTGETTQILAAAHGPASDGGGVGDRDTLGAFMPRVSMLGVKNPEVREERWRRASAGDALFGWAHSGSGSGGLNTGLLSSQQPNTQSAAGKTEVHKYQYVVVISIGRF